MKVFDLQIGNRKVGVNEPVFIIAEIGNNHNGDFDRAKRLIDLAIETGADCAKFQMRNLNSVYRKRSLEKSSEDLSAEYTLDLLKKFELSIEQHQALAKYCKEKGITYMCTPWDLDSLAVLESIGVAAYKVASADLTNYPLIEAIAQTKKPMILSSGMSSEEEIRETVGFLHSLDAQFAILHCNSTYPAPFHSINLNYLKTLKSIHFLVGYSGHERGTAVSLGAVALGAKVIERHFTLDRTMEGPDHAASLEFDDFKSLVEGIRQIESALGDGARKQVSQGEMINRENLAKSLVAAHPMEAGHILTRQDIDIKSPGQGLSPRFLKQLIGQKLTRNMATEDFFFDEDLGKAGTGVTKYSFRRPWGIPVRYHDFAKFRALVRPDLFEFHLSYSDMDLNMSDFFEGTYTEDFVVHAPELFKGSHLMDLASFDEAYRRASLHETQRVIDITRALKKYFPKTDRPMIVCNIGGFTMDKALPRADVGVLYERFLESLSMLDTEGVEILPQTMAPFPWLFGGQRHQNLFVHPEDIATVCRNSGLRICLDVSHSRLTTNHFGYSFADFLKTVGPYVSHLHLGDARGVDGEGLQVGEGEIDFVEMARILDDTCPKAWFIPEIWQGHKNNGQGFWVALERLLGVF